MTSNQINVGDLAEKGDSCDLSPVVDWLTPFLPVTVQPVKAQFKSNQT